MRGKFGFVALVGLALTFAGCGKEVRRDDPQKDTHVDTNPGLFEVEETAQAMKGSIASYRFPEEVVRKYPDGKPRVRLMTVENRTDRHFDIPTLTDKVREVLTETEKVIFVADAGARMGELKQGEIYETESGDVRGDQAQKSGRKSGAAYAMFGRLKNIRKAGDGVKENTIIFTLELVDTESNDVVIIKSKEFRLSKS